MKKTSLINKLFISLVSILTMNSCTKTETIYVDQPAACFTTLITDPFDSHQRNGTTNYIDSNFYFRNCSDTGTNITYHWDFADGSTSNEKNPMHSYKKRGTYTVKLIISNNNRTFDTSQQTVSVILGQQHISFGESINAAPIAIEETNNNEFVLLTSTGYGANYQLLQLDSLYKQKSIKSFPNNFRLTSMESANDGHYIFTGSTKAATGANELIKMSAGGDLLWSKSFPTEEGLTYAAPTVDGGFAVIGLKPTPDTYGNTRYYTTVNKTDNNGNLQWQKILDKEEMIQSKDAIIEQDGIVVAGVKRDKTSSCSDCDSLLIVKLNNSGNIIWKNTVLWGLNTNNWWSTRIAKLKNGNYAVTNEYTRGIFIFSPTGDFLDRKLAPYQIKEIANTSDGNIIALQNEWVSGNRIGITKIILAGNMQWHAYPEGKQKTPGGYSCCSDSWAATITPLRRGGTLVTGQRILNNSSGSRTHNVILLWEVDEAGKPK